MCARWGVYVQDGGRSVPSWLYHRHSRNMVAETDWTGLLAGRRDDEHDVVLSFPDPSIPPVSAGSMPVYCVGKDGVRYWVKLRENPQGDRVPITEQILGRIGALADLPSCAVRRMYISP